MEKSEKPQDMGVISIDESFAPYYTDTFKPGETKEQLELGREVRGDSNSNFKIGTITVTLIGSLTVSGIGFRPKLLTIIATSGTSTPRIVESTGYTDGISTICKYTYEDTASPNYVTDTTTSGIIFNLETGGTNSRANFTSFNSDGFTINVVSLGLAGGKYNYIASK